MDQINAFLDVYGLVAIFVVLLGKAIGVPIPIPADIIILAIAARSAEGRMVAWQTFLVSWLALVLGGTAQFIVIRAFGRKPLYRHGHRIGLTPSRLDTVARNMGRAGPLGIAIVVATPGVRSVVVTGCALAGIRLRTFFLGFGLGYVFLLSTYFSLGFVGASLIATFGWPGVIIVTGVLFLGLLVFLYMKYFAKHPLFSEERVG